jgi:division protein CdvB (Snf7/Vps24/ESCRT-III family)
MGYAGLGLYLSDKAEEKFGFKPTEKDREELRNELRKVIPKISTIEKGNR